MIMGAKKAKGIQEMKDEKWSQQCQIPRIATKFQESLYLNKSGGSVGQPEIDSVKN